MNRRRTQRKKRQSRKAKRGGAINCEAEGFNMRIRQATFGHEYPDAIVSHQNSEQWTFEQLVDISTRGIVGWYCKQANLTPEECKAVTSIPEVQELGAFFHRYKVFSEHILHAKRKLLPNQIFKSEEVKTAFIAKATLKQNVGFNKEFIRCIEIIEPFFKGNPGYDDFRSADIPIEMTIDRVQCLLWVIVKNKGLPEGFIMDERISRRAHEPIILFTHAQGMPMDFITALNLSPLVSAVTLGHLIERVLLDNAELSQPEVTFGVY